ncbi:hypothetical protein BHE74_00021736, partial [Ensete ventricosum]
RPEDLPQDCRRLPEYAGLLHLSAQLNGPFLGGCYSLGAHARPQLLVLSPKH